MSEKKFYHVRFIYGDGDVEPLVEASSKENAEKAVLLDKGIKADDN